MLKQECLKSEVSFQKIHYKVTNTRKVRVIDFICDKHQDKGVQTSTVAHFMTNKRKCAYCSHKRLKDTFRDEIQEINPNIQLLSEYTGWSNHVQCKCLIHDYIWSTSARCLLNGCGCPICGKEKQGLARRNTIEYVKQQLNHVNPNIEIIGEYKGSHNMIKCRCKIDGTEWESIVSNLLNLSAKCPACGKISAHERTSLSQDEFVSRAFMKNPDIIVIGEYYSHDVPVLCKCKKHQIEFNANPRTLLAKDKNGNVCPRCNQSSGERIMEKTLSDLGISVELQYIFPDCKYIAPLRYDAYCKDQNIAFEYQGEQHYMPIDFKGAGEEWAQNEHKIVQKRDQIKRDYCKANNIRLIEIPYWEKDNMRDYLVQQLNL